MVLSGLDNGVEGKGMDRGNYVLTSNFVRVIGLSV